MKMLKGNTFIYSFVGLCALAVIIIYAIHANQDTLPGPVSKYSMDQYQQMNFKKDLPVLYLTDVVHRDREKLLNGVQSRRVRHLHTTKVLGKMHFNRLHDDYRFCRKLAPFLGPYDYIPNSKTPCWYSKTGKLKCVPYFYLVGFSKCGTTGLYYKISSHPDIFGGQKEKHWLNYIRYFENKDSIDLYSSLFSKFALANQETLSLKGYSDRIMGEGSPTYVWNSLYWPCYEGNRGLVEPRYTNADVIYRLNPKAKILIVVRDPVERLYSRYLSWLKQADFYPFNNPSPEKFHKVVTQAIKMYTKCFKDWSPRHCAYNGTLYTQAMIELQEGMYSIFIRDWLKIFPINQVFIMKFEDFVPQEQDYLNRIYSFLNVSALSPTVIKLISEKEPKNVGSYPLGPLLDKTRKQLQEFYAPFNKDLQYLLHDSSFSWGYE